MKGSKPRRSVFTATTTTGDVPGGPWQLGVQHVSGSLDGYVASTLRRNLAIGFGILFLLAAAVAAIIVSSMRARALAHRQLDFVYVDAQHHYEAVKQDIEMWAPKIRRGGILAGHDYLDGMVAGSLYGVRKAVGEFVDRTGVKLLVSREPNHPSWFVTLK